MRMHAVASKNVSSCLLMTVLLFAGCGGGTSQPKSASVTGKVTFQDKPVTEGRLTFMSNISASSVEVTSEGTYLLTEGVPPGKYKVVVTPPSITKPPMVGEPAPVMKKYDNIPEKYRSETSTPLFADIKDGDNTVDLELKP
jgi:hypothetical protein